MKQFLPLLGTTSLFQQACRNTRVVAKHRLVAAAELDDVVIVEADDAVLVLDREHAQDVNKISCVL